MRRVFLAWGLSTEADISWPSMTVCINLIIYAERLGWGRVARERVGEEVLGGSAKSGREGCIELAGWLWRGRRLGDGIQWGCGEKEEKKEAEVELEESCGFGGAGGFGPGVVVVFAFGPGEDGEYV